MCPWLCKLLRGYIKVSWLFFLTCSPSPLVTASIIPDLNFDRYVYLSSFPWALTFLPTGKICSYLLCSEQSFITGVSQDSPIRSTSIGCSELCSTPVVNLLLSEGPKIHLLLPSLPLTTKNPVIVASGVFYWPLYLPFHQIFSSCFVVSPV